MKYLVSVQRLGGIVNKREREKNLPSGTISLLSVVALRRITSEILEADCMITARYNESFIVMCWQICLKA